MSFPTTLDNGTTLPNPSSSSATNNPSHSSLHSSENAAIIAVETKLGTGSTTPASNTLLFGTGAGTSAWQSLTSSQLASVLSDETGTGSAVFANTPTLITPKVDTINESTLNNGVTVGGVSLKAGVISTANAVGTTALASASVTASKLSTGAVTALVATSETTASTSYVDLTTTTDSVTATIGANGLALVILSMTSSSTNGATTQYMSFAASGTNTITAADARSVQQGAISGIGTFQNSWSYLATGLSTGSTTFKAKYRTTAGTATFTSRYITVIPL